jgi:hypothetical protein
MKNAKLISLLAAAALSMSVLAGCSAASSQAASSAAPSAAASSIASSAVSSAANSSASAAQAEAAFTVTDKDGNATDYVLNITEGEKLSDALAAAGIVSADEAAAGFVTTVNGVTADFNKDQAWWMLVDKDGEMTASGIADITLHEGDSYGFVYTVG